LGASVFGAASFVVACARATFAASRRQSVSLLNSRMEIPPGNGDVESDGTIPSFAGAMCSDVGLWPESGSVVATGTQLFVAPL
jgi:hypothetical protein